MGQWVVTVAGIAILSVLCDVILPEGKTRKYIKTVVGIVVTLVMLQPIVTLASNATSNASSLTEGYEAPQVQQSYLDMIEDKQMSIRLSTVQEVLNARGVVVQDIACDKYTKSISLHVNTPQSNDNQATIESVFKTYFDEYKIIIKWKGQ